MLISRRVVRAVQSCKDSATLADMSYYATKNISFGGAITAPKDIAVSPDGTKAIVADFSTSADAWMHGVSFGGDPYNVSGLSYDSTNGSPISIIHIAMNDDGTKGCYIDNAGDYLRCFSLSVGWDPSSTLAHRNGVSLASDVYRGVDFNDVGNRIYFLRRGNSALYQYTCNDWNVATFTSQVAEDFTSLVGDGQGHFGGWNRDGTRFLLTDIGNGYIYERIAASAWTVGSSSAGASFDMSSYIGAGAQLQAHWGPCGNIYVISDNTDSVIQLKA